MKISWELYLKNHVLITLSARISPHTHEAGSWPPAAFLTRPALTIDLELALLKSKQPFLPAAYVLKMAEG